MFIVAMTLKPVPHEVYMAKGISSQFYVTEDHKHYGALFDVASAQALLTPYRH